MHFRQAQRIYTKQALEYWSTLVAFSWENTFAVECIGLGRRIYKEGLIRRIEITSKDITVEVKFIETATTAYSIIQPSSSGVSGTSQLEVRSSTQDFLLKNAIAIAGLYELEEVLSSELTTLPYTQQERKVKDSKLFISNVAELPLAAKPVSSSEKKKKLATRNIFLKFSLIQQGLKIECFWAPSDSSADLPISLSQEIPALPSQPLVQIFHPKRNLTFQNSNLTSREREKVIRLISFFKKQNCLYLKTFGYFLLNDISQIPSFLRKSLPQLQDHFLCNLSPEIEKIKKQGFGKVKIRINTISTSSNLQWQFTLQDNSYEKLSLTESRRLLKSSSKSIIIPNKGIFHIEADQEKFIQDFFESVPNNCEFTKYQLLSLFNQQSENLIKNHKLTFDPAIMKWRQSLLKPFSTEKSISLDAFLRDYQAAGVHWLIHLCNHDCHGLLADEMGLGKTLQILSLITHRPLPLPYLIVCPASVLSVWQQEIEKFFPHIRTVIFNSKLDLEKEMQAQDTISLSSRSPLLVLTSYSQLRRSKEVLIKVNFGYCVLDEAQMIKNPDSKVAHTCFQLKAQHRIALTGTPIENKLLDLWTIFKFLMPGMLGNRSHFIQKVQKEGPLALEKTRIQIAPFILRRNKNELLPELPEKVEIIHFCSLTPRQVLEYQTITQEFIRDEEEKELTWSSLKSNSKRNLSFFNVLTRLRQVCIDPGILPGMDHLSFEYSSKIQALITLLQDPLASERKVVIFSQFVSVLKRIEQALKINYENHKIFKLTGLTRNRGKVVEDFQNVEDSAIMLISLKAGATGITLHAADYLFLMDPWWNPAVENQAIGRIHRLGQKNTTFIYRLITQGTVEERVEHLKKLKGTLASNVLTDSIPLEAIAEHYKKIETLIEYVASPNKNQ